MINAQEARKESESVSNYELISYNRNGYNVVRSDKKKCQEYTGW